MVMLVLQSFQSLLQRVLTFHSLDQLLAGQLIPGSGYEGCIGIMLPQQSNCSIQFLLLHILGTGKNDRGSGFNLIIVELAKVLHIHLDLGCIRHRHSIAQDHILVCHLLHSSDHIRQLTNTGRLDDDSIRMILLDDLGQCLAKITHKAAANTTGIHFGNVDTRILQKTTVDADLTKFVFNQHQLLALVCLFQHLFDQGRLTGTQKTGINVNFCHGYTPSVL